MILHLRQNNELMEITNKIFESSDLAIASLLSDEFDTCTFRNCDFSEIDFSGKSNKE